MHEHLDRRCSTLDKRVTLVQEEQENDGKSVELQRQVEELQERVRVLEEKVEVPELQERVRVLEGKVEADRQESSWLQQQLKDAVEMLAEAPSEIVYRSVSFVVPGQRSS